MTSSLLRFRFDSGIFFPQAGAGSSAAADGGTERTSSLVYVLKKLTPRPHSRRNSAYCRIKFPGVFGEHPVSFYKLKAACCLNRRRRFFFSNLFQHRRHRFSFLLHFSNWIRLLLCFCLCNVRCTLGSHCVCSSQSFSLLVLHIQT